MMTIEEFNALPRLDVQWPPGVMPKTDAATVSGTAQIMEFAAALVAEGKSPMFQIWYPEVVVDGVVVFKGTTIDDYDVLEVVDGNIATVPGQVVAAVEAREAARS